MSDKLIESTLRLLGEGADQRFFYTSISDLSAAVKKAGDKALHQVASENSSEAFASELRSAKVTLTKLQSSRFTIQTVGYGERMVLIGEARWIGMKNYSGGAKVKVNIALVVEVDIPSGIVGDKSVLTHAF